MLHGVIYAIHALHLATMNDEDFADQAHAYFGSGTQLQELYITPSLLNQHNWDDLAEAAKWSRRNAKVLVDTHWIGGDPGKGEIYGWASWEPGKGIIVLRNPDDKPRTFKADVQDMFELPARSPQSFQMRSPWLVDRARPIVQLLAGQPYTFQLEPFQVLVLEAN
jgi:hypothetical protein